METNIDDSLNNISAQIYLNKLREFSDSNLLSPEISIDQILEKTLKFIAQILPVDCAYVVEILNDGKDAMFKSVYGINKEDFCVGVRQVEVMNLLANNISVFGVKDVGARETASFLLNGHPVLSGISVPIEGKSGPRGVLAVYSKSDYKFSSSKVHFVKSMANVIALFLQSSEMIPQVELKNAGLVIEAKREWESAVDSLDRLVVVLDEKSKIIRINKTIQAWGLGTVDSENGQLGASLIQKIVGVDAASAKQNWNDCWSELKRSGYIEWEKVNTKDKKVYAFSLRSLVEENSLSIKKSHQAFAALIVDDITNLKLIENEIKQYTSSLEDEVRLRTSQLQNLNNKLQQELEEHKLNKCALVESEKRYARLIQNSLAGICTIRLGQIDFYNSRFAAIFGAENNELNNRSFVSLISDHDRDKILSAFEQLDEGKGPSDLMVVRARDSQNRDIWLDIKLDYLHQSKDNTILVNVYDITLQKNIELSLRGSEGRLHKLSCQLLTAQEVERKRLAMDLHDGIGQSLSAIKYSVENIIRDNKNTQNGEFVNGLDKIVSSLRETIDDARCMAMNLRPSILDDLGIVSAIHWCCGQFQEAYKHIKVESDISLQENQIDKNIKIVIYRIIQESLNNVAKHSGATKARITLGQNGDLSMCLRIADNGCGFEVGRNDAGYRNNGMGLNSIQERAELTGGVFSLSSNQPEGTVLDIKWPHKTATLC